MGDCSHHSKISGYFREKITICGLIFLLGTTIFTVGIAYAQELDTQNVLDEDQNERVSLPELIDNLGYRGLDALSTYFKQFLFQDLDSDNDGLIDYDEKHVYGTNYFGKDTDSDSLDDRREISIGSNPLKKHTDGDELPDGFEEKYNFNLRKKDTDMDGKNDSYDSTHHSISKFIDHTKPSKAGEKMLLYYDYAGKELRVNIPSGCKVRKAELRLDWNRITHRECFVNRKHSLDLRGEDRDTCHPFWGLTICYYWGSETRDITAIVSSDKYVSVDIKGRVGTVDIELELVTTPTKDLDQ